MARFRCGGSWWHRAIVTSLVMAPVVVVAAQGDEPKPESQAPAPPSAEAKRQAREIFDALRTINQALQNEGKGPASAGASLPPRPAKTIQPPTLDSAQLDSLIEKSLAAAKTPVARLTTDEEFVRRVYLDVAGHPPTPEEMATFVREKDKHKRAKLIDHLLASQEYATNWARYWRDVIRFRAANANPGQVRYPELDAWLSRQFADNKPWDEICQSLITATGRNDENGATVFTIAQMAQPVELAGEVSRIFMGVQIQCAQCHDHPNDPWKREQFHQFAAFFAGTRTRRAVSPAEAKAKGMLPSFEVVAQPGKPRYSMPDLKDPQKQIPVAPKFFLASQADKVPDGLNAGQRRTLAAAYITGQDNPWFAKAFVNRIWYVLMGEAFYNPVDDLGPTRTPNSPEVLEALATQWQQGGYDIKWLFRVILNTKAYQRESRATNTAAGRTPFAANCPSRLRSDQIVDALAQALGVPLGNPNRGGMGKAAVKKAAGAGPQALRNNPRFALGQLFGVDPSTPIDDVLGTIPQALFLMNGPQINRAIQARPGTVLGEILSSTPDNRAALEALYLRVLARRPNNKEVGTCGRYIEMVGDRREAFEDIYWSLINSTEFISRR